MPKTQAESNLEDPKEMFAWMFAAGVPDPRGEKYPNQPMIPGPCMEALSQMLYDFGGRFDPEKQTKWLKRPAGPDMNFRTWETTDILPDAAEMLADIAPEKAAAIAQVTPETHQAALAEATTKMLDSIDRLRAAKELMGGEMKAGGAV